MSDLEGLYQDVIMDHSRRPHHHGLLEHPAAESHQVNPTCGDEITLRVHTDDAGITGLSWVGHGCAISQASASLLSDLVVDTDVDQTRERIAAFRELMRSKGELEGDEELLGDAIVLSGVSRYIARVKCAMLAWVALEDALLRIED